MRLLRTVLLMVLVASNDWTQTFGWTSHPTPLCLISSKTTHARGQSFLTTCNSSPTSSETILENETGANADDRPFPGVDSARELYPHWNVLFNGTLQVDSTHTLSFQILGEPKSNGDDDDVDGDDKKKLVGLFLHGGPGAACFPNHARFFDPERYYRVVLLDQRGCGKSTPTACLTDNTLHDLVEDCERLKEHLEIPHWDVVLGGSWGTTVAIAYGQSYPESVQSMILRGVFLFRPQEIDWLFASNGGAAKQYPTIFQSFAEGVGLVKSGQEFSSDGDAPTVLSPLAALNEHMRGMWEAPNDEHRSKVARSWMQWEFFNSVAHKIPPSTNLSDSNATMAAIRAWQSPEIPPVAVTSKNWDKTTEGENKWNYQSLDGREIPSELLDADFENRIGNDLIQAKFRRDISNGYSIDDPPRETVSITPNILPIGQTSTNLPLQAMLTSFYSSNCDYCRNYLNLLDPDRMKQLEKIPTIIVQGGSDGICPPDSALDLLDAWPSSGTVKLRMPVHGGHSMYDPLVRNELLGAADRMADFLLQKIY